MAAPVRINQVVADWVSQFGVAQCIQFSKQPGGWEKAAQSHLCQFFRPNIPCLVAQREVTGVFPAHPQQQIDFVCPTPAGTVPPFYIIELKCQSTFQDSIALNHFATRLQADIDKVQQALAASFQGGEKWVIGICCNMDISKATVAYNFTVNGQPYTNMSVIPVQRDDKIVHVFYARFV
ncbi:hypothetical protein BC629DRAFT_1192837 [Irpex lacteus]|nr:hypothetical protein BC629DRAFT_1192837 [Irpex lacteus]